MQFLQDLLKDEIFYKRYIQRNATYYLDAIFANYLPVNIATRAFKKCLKVLSDKVPYLRPKFEKRLLSGKIDIPYTEVVLTTKCTLNCQSCNNMMQYFNPHQQYSGTLERIKQDLTHLLESVDSISWLRLIGGEPLLFKDLAKLVEFLDSQNKIRVINIVTNATIKFSDELLDVLATASKRVFVSISDYSCSPNLKVKLAD